MARSALANRPGALVRGPRPWHQAVPALSVIFASALAVLPIMADHGWWPDLGLLMLLAWRLLRADVWPAWVAAPLGLLNDLLTGSPPGLSVALWTAFMLAMDVIDRRTMWRDYWLEWIIAGLFIVLSELAQWRVAALSGAPVSVRAAWPSILVAILVYPLAVFIVSRLDRWRLGQ